MMRNKFWFVVFLFAMALAPTTVEGQTLPPLTGPFIISGVSPSQVTDTTATINWVTSVPATGEVEYGETTSYGTSSGEDQNLLLLHMVNLSDLEPGTLYHYRVSSTDVLGTTQTSGDFTFTTTCSTGDCNEEPPPPNQPTSPTSSNNTTNNYFNFPANPSNNNLTNQPSTTPPSTPPPAPTQPPAPSVSSRSNNSVATAEPSRSASTTPVVPMATEESAASRSLFRWPRSYIEGLFWLLLLLLLLCGLAWVLAPLVRRKDRTDRDLAALISQWVSASAMVGQQDKLRSVLDSLPVGVLVAEAPWGKIVTVNKVMRDTFGPGIDPQAAPAEAGQFNEIVKENGDPYPVAELPLAQTLRTGEPVTQSDIFVRQPNGKLSNIRASSAPVLDLAGRMSSVVEVTEGITQEDKTKSEFVSMASHQLRTPLTGVKWVTDLLLHGKGAKLPLQQQNYVKQISESNSHMMNLVDDLLNVSHIDNGRKFNLNKKPTDVVEIIDSLNNDLAGLAHEHKVTVKKMRKFPRSLSLNVDENKMRQVFQNLLSNAVKYSKPGSKVEVGYDTSNKGQAVFFVRDHGLGIPKQQQSRIFEKFFRADNVKDKATDGTGLGLYIAKTITEKHGGKLWFDSQENKGSTFYVSLPLEAVEVAAAPVISKLKTNSA